MEFLTKIEADAILEKIAEQESLIKAAEDERDTFKQHYLNKIARAENLCEKATREARENINLLTERLRAFAADLVTEKKRSINLPSGTLSFRKQPPKYFFRDDLREVNGKDNRLIDFVRKSAPELLKIKVEESADWATLKTKISSDGDNVFFSDTGEIIEGIQCQFLPDKFSVKVNP